MSNKLLKLMCEFNREYLLALPPKYDQNLCITDTFVAAQGKAKAKESLSTTNTHLVAYCGGERVCWAVASPMTKDGRVDVCADTGECVYICDTLSQQMYVISFRGWSGEGREVGGRTSE